MQEPRVVVHPMADISYASDDYELYVNGKPVPIYRTYQFTPASKTRSFGRQVTPNNFALFDFEGDIMVEVVSLRSEAFRPEDVKIRPLALDIRPAVTGSTITFSLSKPCNISVEPYGVRHPLEIMAGPLETGIPDRDDENTVVIAPGVHTRLELDMPEGIAYYFEPGIHFIDPMDLKSGQTVYLAGGSMINTKVQEDRKPAWVNQHGVSEYRQKPTFCCHSVENVKLIGRGIVSGREAFKSGSVGELIYFINSKDVLVEGIVLLEPFVWSSIFGGNTDLLIQNVKLFGYYMSCDGFSISGGQRATVRDCYIHNADDAFYVKGWEDTFDIRFYNCVVWSSMSDPFGVVHEVLKTVEKVLFKDCTCIHYTAPYYHDEWGGAITLTMYQGGRAKDIVFDGIVVEESSCPLPIIMLTCWGDNQGYLENITLNNITISNAVNNMIKIRGDDEHIKNVRFHNVTINDKPILVTNDDDFIFYENTGKTVTVTG